MSKPILPNHNGNEQDNFDHKEKLKQLRTQLRQMANKINNTIKHDPTEYRLLPVLSDLAAPLQSACELCTSMCPDKVMSHDELLGKEGKRYQKIHGVLTIKLHQMSNMVSITVKGSPTEHELFHILWSLSDSLQLTYRLCHALHPDHAINQAELISNACEDYKTVSEVLNAKLHQMKDTVSITIKGNPTERELHHILSSLFDSLQLSCHLCHSLHSGELSDTVDDS